MVGLTCGHVQSCSSASICLRRPTPGACGSSCSWHAWHPTTVSNAGEENPPPPPPLIVLPHGVVTKRTERNMSQGIQPTEDWQGEWTGLTKF